MPRRFLRRRTAGLALTVLAIAGGVALVCAIHLASGGALRAFVEVVDTMAGRAALQVTAGETGLFPEDVVDTVRAVPGVELGVPVVKGTAFTTDGSAELVTVYGVDVTDEAGEQVYGIKLDVSDPVVFLSQPDSIAISLPFAAAHDLAPGESIELATPAGRRRFAVRGLLEPRGVARAYGGDIAVMDLYAAEEVFTRRGFINGVDVVVKRDDDVGVVAETIARVLPEGAQVETPGQRQANLHRVMQSLQVALQAMGLFGLVAAFLITFNRLSTVFEERAWQLGVLRALGLRAAVVWRELLKESLILGAAGVALGIPLGIGLGRVLLPVIATTSALAYNLVTPHAEFAIGTSSIVLAAAVGFGSALLAAALPAWRASRVALIETMRCRGTEQAGAGVATVWAVRGVAGLVAFGTVLTHLSLGSALSGLMTTGLIAAGTALAARPALEAIRLLLGAGCRRFVGPVGRLATQNLLHNLRRTALTVATVAVGLGCVVWFATMANSFESSLIETLTAAVRYDLVVTSMHVVSGYVEAPVTEELSAEVARVPGVAAVFGSRLVDWPYRGRRIAIEAIDAARYTTGEVGRWPLFGRHLPDVWEAVARGEAAIVSVNFAHNFHAEVGDALVLDTPTGPLTLRIAGATAAFESPFGTVQMAREVYRRYWQDPCITRVGLKAGPGTELSTLRAEIARRLGAAYDLRILSSGELIDYYASQVRRGFAPLFVLAATVLLITLFGVADTLLAGVLERTRELGSVRAIGIRRRHVARMILTEALLLVSVGLVLAMSSGLALALLWVKETLPDLLGWVLQFHIPYRHIYVLVVLSVVVSLAAALLPACRAARLDPQLALRCE